MKLKWIRPNTLTNLVIKIITILLKDKGLLLKVGQLETVKILY